MHETRSSRKRKRIEEENVFDSREENLEEFRSSQEKILLNGWDAFREEYSECEREKEALLESSLKVHDHVAVEQLPLSICRNFTLLARLDMEANGQSD